MIRIYGLILLLACLSLPVSAADSGDPEKPGKIVPVGKDLVAFYKLKGDFYKKGIDAGGLWILSSDSVDDRALHEARYLILGVLKGRPDVRAAMVKKKVRLGVMAYNEFTRDIPEHKHLPPFYNMRARGLGGNPVTCGEENLLHFQGTPYRDENILIHEFSHAFHTFGLRTLDKSLRKDWAG